MPKDLRTRIFGNVQRFWAVLGPRAWVDSETCAAPSRCRSKYSNIQRLLDPDTIIFACLDPGERLRIRSCVIPQVPV